MKETLYQGKFLNMAKEGRWEFCERVNNTTAVMIFAATEDNCVLLVEEMRPPIGMRCICFPAGLCGDVAPESSGSAAMRELLEETGYTAADMQFLFTGPSSPGLTSETLHFFLARGLQKRTAGGGVDGENITVHEVPLADIDSWLQSRMAAGIAVDPRVYTGLYFLQRGA